jgi:hypothetical protein
MAVCYEIYKNTNTSCEQNVESLILATGGAAVLPADSVGRRPKQCSISFAAAKH